VPAVGSSKKLDPLVSACRLGDFKSVQADLTRLSKDPGADGEGAKKLLAWIEELGAKKVAQEAGYNPYEAWEADDQGSPADLPRKS